MTTKSGELSESERVAWLARSLLAAAESARVGVMVTVSGRTLRNVYANPAAERIFGRGPGELVEMDPTALLTQLERGRFDPLIEQFSASGEAPASISTVITRRSGGEASLEVGLGAVTLDDGFGVVSFTADVTDGKSAAESLRRSEERFRSVVEAIPEAILITEGTRMEYANPAFRTLMELGAEHRENGLDMLSLVHPDDAERLSALIDELPSGVAAHLECRFNSLGRNEVVFELAAISVELGGKPRNLFLGHDVTERKRLEGKLLQTDRLGVLGTLAAGMAHSINNPLAYTLLNLEHVSRRMRNLSPEQDYYAEARVRLAEAHDGADRIAKVVRQMRALSRSRSTEPAPVDLRLVLENVLAMVGNEIRYRGQLSTRYEAAPRVLANEGELEQSLLGLLLYVARSLPEDPSSDREIRLTLGTSETGEAVVTVSDDGLTLVEAERVRLFDPFTSGDAAGLGLAMCHAIFSALEGRIDVESYPEKGTIFRVTLPAARGIPAAVSRRLKSIHPTALPSQTSARARVLVIDDDPGVASALRAMLEANHEVRSVDRAREGLRLLLGPDEFDIVFCDLIMPEVSGVDLYCSLELNRPDRTAQLVFMTGGVFTPEAEKFLASVPNPRVEKPFSLARVEQLLAQAVAKRPAEAS